MANFFKPGDSSASSIVSILVAMNDNISKINEGMQTALLELKELRAGQQELPQHIYEYTAVRQVAGELQALGELVKSKENAGPTFNERAYYRDMFEIYREVRKVRQEAINGSYAVSENLVLHIPLLFMLEAETYSQLTGTMTGGGNDPYAQYGVNVGSWVAALRSYLQFYETALNPKIVGSFAAERIALESEIDAELKRYDGGSMGTFANGITGTATCYYELTKSHTFGDLESDDRGPRFWPRGYEQTYKLGYIDYWIEREGFPEEGKTGHPLSQITRDDVDLGEYELETDFDGRTRVGNDWVPVTKVLGERHERLTSGYYCTKDDIIPRAEVAIKDPFNKMNVSNISKMASKLNLLVSINDLNKAAAPKLYALAKVYSDSIDLTAYPTIRALVPENLR